MVFYIQLSWMVYGMCGYHEAAWLLGKQRVCQAAVLCNIWFRKEHNYIALYIFGCICATAFEYLKAQVMLKLFGEVWWNYDHLKFNYKGIICLQSTLAWGFVAVFIFGFLNKFVERFVFSIDYSIASVMAMILVFSYTADFMQRFSESLNLQNIDIRAEMRKFIKMFHR